MRKALILALSVAFPTSAVGDNQSAVPAPHVEDDCRKEFAPRIGQSGKDVMWIRTPDLTVVEMLRMAKTGPTDRVVDLGAGDGKIAITAARDFGATARGIEYDPALVRLAQCEIKSKRMTDRVSVSEGDIFKADFSDATVLTMFLLPELNLCIRHRVLALRPGTRVVSNRFDMGEWGIDATTQPDPSKMTERGAALLWIVPARVDGVWSLHGPQGLTFSVDLTQNFQKVGGRATFGSSSWPLVGVRLRGKDLSFNVRDDSGNSWTFRGTVEEDSIAGLLQNDDRTNYASVIGSREGPTRTSPWAEMAPDCQSFYAN